VKLGNNLRRCRFDHDEITQQALANAVGVTRLTIHSIEKGKFIPSTYLALKLARFFGKSVEKIFYIHDEESSESADRAANMGGDHGKKS
jgi:putative transcriptional regulator